VADTQTQETLSNTAQGLFKDMERLLSQRLDQLRDEVRDELGKATTAGASLGGGLGMAALGTILGGIGFVHLLQKVTGLPLWLCYAGSSATACVVAAGLVAEGVKKASELDILPEGTGQAMRDAVVGDRR